MIAALDAAEGIRYVKLWTAIVAIDSCLSRLQYLEAYGNRLRTLDMGRQEKVIEVTAVPFATIESSKAQCISELYRRDQVPEAELRGQIEILTGELETTFNSDLRQMLSSDIASLTQLVLE